MKNRILDIYSLRAKFKFDAKVLCVELVIMNHETSEITEFRIPLSYNEKVEKIESGRTAEPDVEDKSESENLADEDTADQELDVPGESDD